MAPQLRPASLKVPPSAVVVPRRAKAGRTSDALSPGPERLSHAPTLPRPIRDTPLVVLVAAVGGGIGLDRMQPLPVPGWCGLSLVALLTWWLVYRRRRCCASSLLLLCAALALGGLWHHVRWHLFRADELARHTGEIPKLVEVQAAVAGAPRWSPEIPAGALDTMQRGQLTRLTLRLQFKRSGDRWVPASGRATLVVAGNARRFLHGDRIQFSAKLTPIASPLNPGEPDYAAVRRQRRELCSLFCRHPDGITLTSRGASWSPLRLVARLQLWAQSALGRHVGPRQAGLACAMVLGNRELLDPATTDDFFLGGAVHLLAVSGLHLGILASLLWLTLRTGWLPRRTSLVVIVTLVLFYAALTGCRPPVVRATILMLVLATAKWTGRRAVPQNSLAAAGLLTLAWSPAGLFDTGTQLSFLAVTTIFCWANRGASTRADDPLKRLIQQSRPLALRVLRRGGGAVAQAYALTAVVWLATAPLVALRFHLAAPVGILLNPLLWLPVATALFSGFGVLLSAAICPPLADSLGWVSERALTVVHGLTHAAARVPGGHAWVCGPPAWWVLVFYGLSLLVAKARRTRLGRWPVSFWLAWLAMACLLAAPLHRVWQHRSSDKLTISFAAVGHGTCVLLELPDGKTLLYDAGRLGSARSAARPICALLWARKIHHLDAVVLSHADVDHFNAVPAVLRRFSVGVVYVSPMMFQQPSPAVSELRCQIRRAGVPLGTLAESARLRAGSQVSVEVLHPPREGCRDGDNADSLVLLIRFAGRCILLPGDLESPGLDELLAEMPVACEILMAPHHGSRHSRPERVARWCTPRHVVISGGYGAETGEVLRAFTRSGARAWHTQRDGAVTWELGTGSVRRR